MELDCQGYSVHSNNRRAIHCDSLHSRNASGSPVGRIADSLSSRLSDASRVSSLPVPLGR
jgi:hypothetical protein